MRTKRDTTVDLLLRLRGALFQQTGKRFRLKFGVSGRLRRSLAAAGEAPLALRSTRRVAEDLLKHIECHKSLPKIVLVPGGGFVAVETGPEEKSPCGLLEGRVAFVTGAASGLGRGIAMGFLRAGAYVAMYDVNEERLREAEAEARKINGPERVLSLVGSVTDEAGLAKAFADTVLAFGGVDVLLNAASIAPSYPLVDFPTDAWRKSLELNLTGYFLAAREAARLMIKQGMGGSIINLSSKTGLDASKNNSAYNATKAGEIHLARGWALELGEHNIRVNAIAPGNVFKGSLIWNKEYLKACAKKRGIKPEEVIPYYIGLTALKQEILPDDVANTAVFLASDMAAKITGQTIVPDAGQVFVR
jgi:NAD(P)-dependent dehydrogenase (short-subunit alcohol dehydrogenase family)